MTSRNSVPVYANPILNADWPDPDAVQVRGTYYMVASSFNRVPGLPILKSRNLVDWEHAGHALLQLPQGSHFSLVRHGGGVWAPALRYHDGRFWIFYPDPDHGIFVLSAEKAEGPWTAPHLLYAGRGLIDPCPLWDDDGQAYLVHGWANSRIGIKNRLTVHRMSPDAGKSAGPRHHTSSTEATCPATPRWRGPSSTSGTAGTGSSPLPAAWPPAGSPSSVPGRRSAPTRSAGSWSRGTVRGERSAPGRLGDHRRGARTGSCTSRTAAPTDAWSISSPWAGTGTAGRGWGSRRPTAAREPR